MSRTYRPKFQIQDADPYLMYRNSADQIVGIWFYDAAERVALAKLLREITDSYKQKALLAAASAAIATAQQQLRPQQPLPFAPAVAGQRKIDIAALMMATVSTPVPVSTATASAPASIASVTAASSAPLGSSVVAAQNERRERLRAKLRALVDDDAFLDSILTILSVNSK